MADGFLPLFPLAVVLYPTERMPLHIFEPRYREMTQHCLDHNKPFGIVYANDDKQAQIGCSARIVRVMHRYEDGRLVVMVEGERRFRVLHIEEGAASYLTAKVDWLTEPTVPLEVDQRERLITQHMRLLELAGRQLRPNMYNDLEFLSFIIAHNAGLSDEQKQAVLEIADENARVRYLIAHLERFLPQVEQAEDLRRKVQSNGHIRDFPLKEE